jgi:hypothetical protein
MSLKPNIKALGMALIVALAFAAVAASAAQATAPRFTVEKAEKGETTFGERPMTGSNEGAVKLENPSRSLKLESPNNGNCTAGGTIFSSNAGESSSFNSVTLTCTNVHTWIAGVDRTAICPAHSVGAANGTIATKDTDGHLVWRAATGDASVGMTFTPEAGAAEPFAEIEITGATCPLNTNGTPLKVLGNAIAVNDTPTTKDATTQKIEFPSTAVTEYWENQTPTRTAQKDSGLTLGATAATFVGTFALKLTSDQLWGVEPG